MGKTLKIQNFSKIISLCLPIFIMVLPTTIPYLAAVTMTYLVLSSKNKLFFKPRLIRMVDFVLILLLSWCVISLYWSPQTITSLGVTIKLILFTTCCYVFASYQDKLYVSSNKYLVFFFCILVLMLEKLSNGLMQHSIKSLIYGVTGRTLHPFGLWELNFSATMLLLYYWVIFNWAIHERKYGLITVISGFFLLLMVNLDALAGILALLCGLGTYGFLSIFKNKGIKIVTLSLILLISITPKLLGTQDPDISARKLDFLPDSAIHRLYIWNYTEKLAEQRAWIGWGIDASRHLEGEKLDTVIGKMRSPLHPHNIVMQFYLELGIVGVILLILLVASGFHRVSTTNFPYYTKKSVISLIITYMVIAMTAYSVWHMWFFSSFALALGLVLNHNYIEGPRGRINEIFDTSNKG